MGTSSYVAREPRCQLVHCNRSRSAPFLGHCSTRRLCRFAHCNNCHPRTSLQLARARHARALRPWWVAHCLARALRPWWVAHCLGWAADVSSPVLSPILQRQGQLQRGMVPSKARRGRSARPRNVTTRDRPFPTRTSAVSAFPSWFVPPTLLDGRAAGPRRAWVYGGAGGGAPQTVEMHGGGIDGETARSRIAFQLNLVLRVWVNESGRTRRPRIPNPPTRLCLGLAFDRSSFELLSARLEKVSLTRSLSSTICTCLYITR